MMQIRKDLCLGCGLCVENCQQGAIAEMVPVSKKELQTTVCFLEAEDRRPYRGNRKAEATSSTSGNK